MYYWIAAITALFCVPVLVYLEWLDWARKRDRRCDIRAAVSRAIAEYRP